MEEKYVFENTEVVKTGRTALKKLPSGRVDELIEITPVAKFDGVWKKWARDSDLYQVKEAPGGEPDVES